MSSLELLICIFLICVSAYLSASEVALFSLSRFQLRTLRDHFRPAYRNIKRLLSDPGGILVSILIANELVNVTLSSLIAGAVSRQHLTGPSFHSIPSWGVELILSILITSPLILFFCEITPKVIGNQINQLISPLTAGSLVFLYHFFKPIRTLLKFVLKAIAPNNLSPFEAHTGVLKESEFLMMVEEGRKEGAIQQTELDLIKNVFELNETSVSEITTPLSQVLTFSVNTTFKTALQTIGNRRFSRIPVLIHNKKEVAGILYTKDLLRAKLQGEEALENTPVATLIRKPFVVSSTMRLNSLFRLFKQNKIHMAIVKNANGTVTGVVTMSDILDYLFEDFFSEELEPKA